MKIFKHLKGFTILMMALLIVFSACQNEDENVSGPSDTLNETNSIDKKNLSKDDFNLDVLAKGLAIVLRDQNNRKILEDELRTSKKVENIIECSEFLEKVKDYTSNGKKSNQTLKKLLKEVLKGKDLKEIERTMKNLDYGLIDIYMPVKEHLKNWKYTDEILVVPVDNEKAEQEKQIKAYDSELNEINLSTEEAPEIPSLVVTFSEKNKQYYREVSNETETQSLSKITSTKNYYLREIRIGHDYDSGWFGGEMEIYLMYKINSDGWVIDSPIINMYGGDGGTINVIGDGASRLIAGMNWSDTFKIEIWEYDGYFNIYDDYVADFTWNKYRLGHTDTIPGQEDQNRPGNDDDFGSWIESSITNVNLCKENGGDIQIVDGEYNGDDYDYLILGLNSY